MILELFRTFKTQLIALFDEWYFDVASIVVATAATVVVVTAASPGDKEMPYREFNNTKPPQFNSVRDLITTMRWISDVEG